MYKPPFPSEASTIRNNLSGLDLDTAISININSIAIVGGIVRDLITKYKHKDYEIVFNDLDIISGPIPHGSPIVIAIIGFLLFFMPFFYLFYPHLE